MPLPDFCDCADRFESTLVANPEDRFSRDKANMSFPEPEHTHLRHVLHTGASFTKQLSNNVGLSEIPYHKILSLNLRYFVKLAPA